MILRVRIDRNGKSGQSTIDRFFDKCAENLAGGVFEISTNSVANRIVAIFDQRHIAGALNIDTKMSEIRFAIDRLYQWFRIVRTQQLIDYLHFSIDDRRSIRAGQCSIDEYALRTGWFILPFAASHESTIREFRSNSIGWNQLVVDVGEFRFGNARRFDGQYGRTERDVQIGDRR